MSDIKYCTYCNSSTKQKLVFKTSKFHVHEVAFKNEKDDLTKSAFTIMSIEEKVFQCLGCERIHIFYTEKTLNEDPDHKPNEYQLPRKLERCQPSWFKDINLDYFELLGEIYSNYNSNNLISFSICCRTLIDSIITSSVGDIGGFEKKLTAYKNKGNITSNQNNILTFLVESGNASAHRAYKPSTEIAESLIDIVEQILKEQVLVKKSSKLANEIPKRNS